MTSQTLILFFETRLQWTRVQGSRTRAPGLKTPCPVSLRQPRNETAEHQPSIGAVFLHGAGRQIDSLIVVRFRQHPNPSALKHIDEPLTTAVVPLPMGLQPARHWSCVLRRKQRLRHKAQAVDVSDLDVEVGDLGERHPRRALGHLQDNRAAQLSSPWVIRKETCQFFLGGRCIVLVG